MLAGTLQFVEGILRGKQVRVAEVQHILFLEYRLPLGCCVHLTPVFEAIKRSRPEVQITIATRGLGAQVHRHSPFVDYLIETPDPLTTLSSSVRELRSQLSRRRLRPDCVLTGASDSRTKISLLGLLSAPGWRGGYTLKPVLYQRPLVYEPSLSLIANNLRLTELVGCHASEEEPRVFHSSADAAAAAALLREVNPESRPLVVLVTQNSGGQNTGWRTDRFCTVIQAMHARGYAVAYVGTEGDVPAIAALIAAAGDLGVSIAGRTTVTELAAVLALSDLVITLDTGTMHVGRAAGVPMVVLGPSWQEPLEWLPIEIENVRILRGESLAKAPPGYRLDEISPESVIGAADDLLALYPPLDESRRGRLNRALSDCDHRMV